MKTFRVIKGGKWTEVSEAEYNTAKPFGLGDAVAVVAQPIARALDSVLGTNIQECGGCKQRQAALNKLVPRL